MNGTSCRSFARLHPAKMFAQPAMPAFSADHVRTKILSKLIHLFAVNS
ncbi:MAG: hypothetical protein IKE03_03440 [Blautia sp.]|nr:hypothetical protein [Blautia sp.]